MKSHTLLAAIVLTAVLTVSVQATDVTVANDIDSARANETIEVKPVRPGPVVVKLTAMEPVQP